MARYSFDKEKHIHYLDGKRLYGTSTILDVLNKPGLTWWASGQACAEFGWTPLNKDKDGKIAWRETERLKNRAAEARIVSDNRFTDIVRMSSAQYFELLDKAYRAHNDNKNTAATKGTKLHEHCETYIKRRIAGDSSLEGLPAEVLPFVAWSENNVKRFLFSEIHCYSERLWVGGITDFAYEDMHERWILADVKSAKEAYFANMVQMGGYNLQLIDNGGMDMHGELTFTMGAGYFSGHAVFHFGEGFTEPTISYLVERNRRAFENTLALYKDSEEFDKNKAAAA